jgi:hypothetical protein
VFGRNMSPIVHAIARDVLAGSLEVDRYRADHHVGDLSHAVNDLLSHLGVDASGHPPAGRNLMRMAEGMNVDALQLTSELVRRKHGDDCLLAKFHPKHPLLVDGRQPRTLDRATAYVSALLAQGVKTPPVRTTVKFEIQEGAFAGRHEWTGTLKGPGLQTTAMNSDIDGPFAASYGQQGIDVELRLAGQTTRKRFHLRLPEALPGQVVGITARGGAESPQALVSCRIGQGAAARHHQAVVDVTPEQHQLLSAADPKSLKTDYVEGLSARFFSAESVDFWQQVSQRNKSGGEFRGNVRAPSIVFNTFGSHGTRAFENSAELVTSFARSVQGRDLPATPGKGIVDAPDVRVYSGGTTLNVGGKATAIGLSPQQQQAMSQVARRIGELVAVYAQEYGLSRGAFEAWENTVFANPDIPSIIMPSKLITEMAGRTDATHPGKTYVDLQQEIERDLTRLIADLDMGQFVKLHHTPSAPGDQVALMKAEDEEGNRPEFTTEWQFAVTGQKAMPVLDAVAHDLKKNFGIDLKAALEADGHSYGDIRRMSLDETVRFFSGYVRGAIDTAARTHAARPAADGVPQGNAAAPSGPRAIASAIMDRLRQLTGLGAATAPLTPPMTPPVTPHVIVPVDTYYEKGGKIDGSDASLIRSAVALYGADRTCVVQVDTGGGKETPGRSPLFRISADERGRPRLDRHVDGDGKGPVDPHGPNGQFAPTLYVRSADDMGKVFSAAYRVQSSLSGDELQRLRSRA